MLDRVSSFALEFTKSLLRVANQDDRQTASQLGNLLAGTCFEMSVFKSYGRWFANFEDDTTKHKEKIMNDN